MEIKELIQRWRTITDEAIEFKNIDISNLQKMFRETLNVIKEFSNENLVPKEISKLLLEINNFGWWVSGLEETPLHEFYQELLSLISALNKYFFTHHGDVKDIIETIEKISEGEFKSLEIKYE